LPQSADRRELADNVPDVCVPDVCVPDLCTLLRVASGVSVTDGTPTFAGNATVGTMIAAINALGNGWVAQTTGYDAWPSADLYCPNGVSGGDSPNPSGQGALTAAGQFAELKLHTYELAGYQLDQRRGWLLRAIPYTDPELLHPEDLIWPVGINNFRVQYTAGFATVPEDIQEACAELVATWFQQRGQNLNMQSEDTASTYKYTRWMQGKDLPPAVVAILKPYRLHKVLAPQG
jgi:hypothetical protein